VLEFPEKMDAARGRNKDTGGESVLVSTIAPRNKFFNRCNLVLPRTRYLARHILLDVNPDFSDYGTTTERGKKFSITDSTVTSLVSQAFVVLFIAQLAV